MELLDFLKALSKQERKAFAGRCETSVGHLLNVAYGCKEASAHLAINIEAETGGAVLAETVAPKSRWHVIRGKCHCREQKWP